MYEKKLRLAATESSELAMTKEERYELIAQIAQGLDEFKESELREEKQIWDSNDTDLNFDVIINRYN